MSSQYDKLDFLIVELIKQGRSTFAQIDAQDVKAESQRLELEFPRKPAFRHIDSRLQALRKKGLIEHRKGRGWVLKAVS
jgi:hypothetical protein